jgi:hypothetical protein
MFLDSSTPQDILADTYIPFDCEFLIARQDEKGGISLTEVYRISKGMSLLSRYFGYWISQTNHHFPATDLYSRRPSLEGLLISAATFKV